VSSQPATIVAPPLTWNRTYLLPGNGAGFLIPAGRYSSWVVALKTGPAPGAMVATCNTSGQVEKRIRPHAGWLCGNSWPLS
jgi:hypothetical protein